MMYRHATATGLLLLLCGGASPCTSDVHRSSVPPSTQGAGAPSGAEIEAAVRAALTATHVKAASVALVRGAAPAAVLAVGTRTGPGDAPADESTVFRAASLSKPVFAYLVFTLVNEGRLDLDRPLHQYLDRRLPEYPEYADLAGDARYEAITARLALSHRTGFPNWRWQTDGRKLGLQFSPGEKFLYSGEGYLYLQFVVEHITGQDLATLARERVFRPLGMTRSSYVWRDEYEGNCAVDRAPIEKVFGKAFLGVPNSAGSLLTTAADYGRFLGAVLTGQGLPARWRDDMLRPQTALASERLFGPAVKAGPVTGREQGPFWCLGWGGFPSAAGAVRFHVGYDSPDYENYAAIYLDGNLGLVVLTSGGRGPDAASPVFVKALVGDTDTPFRWMGY
jgi:CubicO group peptidase (beta-lactamase class C family)